MQSHHYDTATLPLLQANTTSGQHNLRPAEIIKMVCCILLERKPLLVWLLELSLLYTAILKIPKWKLINTSFPD